MKRLIFIVGFVAWFLVGCYDDKGNYDYAPANNLKIKGIPTDTAVQSYEGLKLVPEYVSIRVSPAGTGRIEGDLFSGVYPKYGGRRG